MSKRVRREPEITGRVGSAARRLAGPILLLGRFDRVKRQGGAANTVGDDLAAHLVDHDLVV